MLHASILVESKSSEAWGTFSEGKDVTYSGVKPVILYLCLPVTFVIFGFLVVLSVLLVRSCDASWPNYGSSEWTKKSYNIPLIVFASFVAVVGIVCIIVLSTAFFFYKKDADPCNAIYSVVPDYQSVCRPSPRQFDWVLFKRKAFFDTNDSKATAYQYKLKDYLALGKEVREKNYPVDDTIPGNGFKVLFNASMVPKDAQTPVGLHYSYETSQNVTIILIQDEGEDREDFSKVDRIEIVRDQWTIDCYAYYGEKRHLLSCTLPDKNVTAPERSFSFDTTQERYVIAVNQNPTALSIKGSGGFNTTFHVMDKDKAVQVCDSSCSFSDLDETKIVVDYTGTDKADVPVSLIIGQLVMNRSAVYFFYCMIPIVAAAVIVTFLLFVFRLYASKDGYERVN